MINLYSSKIFETSGIDQIVGTFIVGISNLIGAIFPIFLVNSMTWINKYVIYNHLKINNIIKEAIIERRSGRKTIFSNLLTSVLEMY